MIELIVGMVAWVVIAFVVGIALFGVMYAIRGILKK